MESGVKEASDLVAIPGQGLLVVSDTSRKATLVGFGGSTDQFKLEGLPKNKPSQLEGVAFDATSLRLFVAREEQQEIWDYQWDPSKSREPKRTQRIAHSQGGSNNGLEGLVHLDCARSPLGRPVLIGVKEKDPIRLVMFEDSGTPLPNIKLDRRLGELCTDLSAITVDPQSGHLFVASEETATVAELSLELRGSSVEAKVVQSFVVRDEKDRPLSRVEGLAFDERGDLHVLTENDGLIRRYQRA